ncbi:MAG: ABC transporter permease [Ruminococcus sp.]|nr:ABC transporter permease [Ruminococcus sp.]
MRFEGLLAVRYIKEQKRHSLLTICSIALALTLMTMIFVCYGTLQKCMGNASYALDPYHMKIMDVTEEQFSILENDSAVKSAKLVKAFDGYYNAELFFKKGIIEDFEIYKSQLSEKLGWDSMAINDRMMNGDVIVNRTLMNNELIDDEAHYQQLETFCILFFYVIIIAIALRMIIDTAFEISSKERERQFGVLQSIGASPKQIVKIITSEGFILSFIGIPIGIICGICVAYIAFKTVLSTGIAEAYLSADKITDVIKFYVSPLMIAVSAVTGLVWVLLSAYGTGMRIIKMSPVEAIISRKNNIVKVKKHSLTGLLFGWTGKLASRNARRQRKRFIITIISLSFSITLYAGIGCAVATVKSVLEDSFSEVLVADIETELLTDCTDPLSYKPVLEGLENCGYLDVIASRDFLGKEGDKSASVSYLNRYFYNEQFEGNPPVSYDDLTKSGEYIRVVYNAKADKSKKTADLTVKTFDVDTSKEGYEEYAYSYLDLKNNYSVELSKDVKLNIADTAELENEYENVSKFNYYIGTLDMYENGLYKEYGNLNPTMSAGCMVKSDEMYSKAIEYIESNEENIHIEYDTFNEMRKIRRAIAAIQTGAGFITFLISLIAIVNMVNIISTGIINRKSETASMQCVGMSEGQLYRMTLAECLEYVIISTIMALVMCAAVISGTMVLLDTVELMTNDVKDYIIQLSKDTAIRVLQVSIVAFLVTVISAFIPLRRMQKDSLVERIKSVD